MWIHHSCILLLLLSLVCITSCESPRAQYCERVDSITIQLAWLMQGQFSGFLMASNKFFFNDECLDVTLKQGGPDIPQGEVLKEGKIEFAVMWMSTTLNTRDQGYNFINVFQHYHKSGQIVASLRSSGIDSFAKMRGKRVGYWKGDEYALLATIRKNGMDEKKDLVMVQQSFSPLALVNGEIDTASLLTYNEYAQLLTMKKPSGGLYTPRDIYILDYNEEGTSLLEDGLIVNGDWLNRDPRNRDITLRLIRAVIRGFIYARDHVDETVNAFYEKGVFQQWQVNEVNKLIWPSEDGIGKMPEAVFNRTASAMIDYGVIKNASSVIGAYTNEFVVQALKDLEGQGYDVRGLKFIPKAYTFCLDKKSTDLPFFCKDRLSDGAIAGIVVGSVLGVIALIALMLLVSGFGAVVWNKSKSMYQLSFL